MYESTCIKVHNLSLCCTPFFSSAQNEKTSEGAKNTQEKHNLNSVYSIATVSATYVWILLELIPFHTVTMIIATSEQNIGTYGLL